MHCLLLRTADASLPVAIPTSQGALNTGTITPDGSLVPTVIESTSIVGSGGGGSVSDIEDDYLG